ncbi:predicted protein [Nematostella vectensis]|uniref:Protein FAM177A1 n=1 Tax=Nematostella vectensis TaxID=45351 RepID=A7RIY0_NEMVE|nr:protein FAM177A1 [Nematostella vectensis]EDO48588.1 predicted protein [Nematostella vectensis]|eukprot:XP_001640651.1 predicted protein [Nematostella vectensis]
MAESTAPQTKLNDAKTDEKDKDEDDSIDLGTTSPPQVGFIGTKHEFETINFDADEEDEDDTSGYHTDERRKKRFTKKKKKKEEVTDSSSDDEDDRALVPDDTNPSDLTWPLWLWYYVVAVSTGALKVAEYLGEKLAYFFGITSPKYQYVIDEFYRLKEQEKEEKERERREREYVEKMNAERLARLEGGDGSQKLTMPKEEALPQERDNAPDTNKSS